MPSVRVRSDAGRRWEAEAHGPWGGGRDLDCQCDLLTASRSGTQLGAGGVLTSEF